MMTKPMGFSALLLMMAASMCIFMMGCSSSPSQESEKRQASIVTDTTAHSLEITEMTLNDDSIRQENAETQAVVGVNIDVDLAGQAPIALTCDISSQGARLEVKSIHLNTSGHYSEPFKFFDNAPMALPKGNTKRFTVNCYLENESRDNPQQSNMVGASIDIQ